MVLGSIALFIPHPVVSTLWEERGEDRRIALEDPILLPDDVTASDVSGALSKDTGPHILLVTGTNTATSEPTVFGAYLPQESGVALHLLFQLRPRFRLLKWSGTQEKQMYTIDIANEAPSLNSVPSLQEAVDKNRPFCIGQSTECNCIRVGPGKRLATLMGFPRNVENLELLKHNDSGSNDMTQRENVEVIFSDITILRVSGSMATAVPGLMNSSWTSDPPAGIAESPEVRIQGEELRRRIMGFGSG
jgi:hypothetical protein